jgi:mono/diheme cytochrome c family protein
MTQPHWVLALTSLVAIAAGVLRTQAASPSPRETAQTTPSSIERQSYMRHHFADVAAVHAAIIRGDLAAVRVPATALARMPVPPGTLTVAVPFVVAISEGARQALGATTVPTAAEATAFMLQQCGECHRAAKAAPSPPPPPAAAGGAHMIEHQRAMDELLQGLVVPSVAQWDRGAGRLRTAPLRPGELPTDPGLADSLRRADDRVHLIADRAAKARTSAARANVYADLLTTCAECHSLHRKTRDPRGL